MPAFPDEPQPADPAQLPDSAQPAEPAQAAEPTPPTGFAPPDGIPTADPRNPFAPPPYAQQPYAHQQYAHQPYAHYPPHSALPPYPPPKSPKHTGLWVLLGVIGVVMVLACCGLTMNMFRTIGRSAAGSGEATGGDVSVGLGEPVRYDDFEFLIADPPVCSASPRGKPGEQVAPRRGQFCSVRIEVTNRGKAGKTWPTFGAWAFTVREDEDGVEPNTEDGLAAGELPEIVLGPGRSATATALFDLERGDRIEYIALDDGGSSTSDPVYVDM